MTVKREPKAASVRIGFCFKRKDATSAKVYLPRFLSGSAINNRIIGQPTKNPMEYIKPSNPVKKTKPDIPKKDAADIKSPEIAKPFCKPEMFPPAV